MTRNHFSKYSGPYFINDGLSKHTDHDHEAGHNHGDIKPDIKVFYFISMLFGILLVAVGTFLTLTP